MATDFHFEVFPEMHDVPVIEGVVLPGDPVEVESVPTGEFGWRFQDANGDITFIGGQPFTRREDAHRALKGAAYDVVRLVIKAAHGLDLVLPIVDLDADGKPIAEE